MGILTKMETAAKKSVEISYVQLWAIIIAIAGSMLLFWKSTDVRLSSLEIRVTNQEMSNQRLENKIDKVQDGINDVRLVLRDKADRK